MSDYEGAAQASAAQTRRPTPLPDTSSARRDPDREQTPPRGLGAPTTRAPLLPTPAVDCGDIRTERRRRDSGSDERRTLRWERTPSPQDEGRRSLSPIQYDTNTTIQSAENSPCVPTEKQMHTADPKSVDQVDTPTLKPVFDAASALPLSCCYAIQTQRKTRADAQESAVHTVTPPSVPVHGRDVFTEKFVMILEPF